MELIAKYWRDERAEAPTTHAMLIAVSATVAAIVLTQLVKWVSSIIGVMND